MSRRRWIGLLVLASLAVGVPAAHAAKPNANFTFSPSAPVAGEGVRFTSTSSSDSNKPITSLKWDLDDDGKFDDASGPTATRSFGVGAHKVRLQVTDSTSQTASSPKKEVTVSPNRPPTAAFSVNQPNPFTGDVVGLASTSSDPDGRPVLQQWDLNNDGVYGDGTGASVATSFPLSGFHTIGLKVTDSGGALAFSSLDIMVRSRLPGAPISPRLLSPFPRVRIRGVATAGGVRLRLLAVRTGGGTRILVRCRGRSCPWTRKLQLARFSASVVRVVRIRGLSRRTLSPGTVLRVFVTRSGMIGKYTWVKFRRLKPPLRVDRCTPPGLARAQTCPRG